MPLPLEQLKTIFATAVAAEENADALTEDLKQAHIRAVYVEDAAKICYYAKGIGEVHVMSDEAIRAMKGE